MRTVRRAATVAVGIALTATACAGSATPTAGRGTPTANGARPSTAATANPAGARPPSAADADADRNRQRAQVEVDRLMRLAQLPPGAVALTGKPPQGLGGPAMGRPGDANLIDRSRLWRVDMPLDEAFAWLQHHPPKGLHRSGDSSGSFGGGHRVRGIGYADRDTAGYQEPQLEFAVTDLDARTAGIRVDALAIWVDPRPLRDTVPGVRLRVTVAGGCPGTDRGVVGVRNPGAPDLDAALLPAAKPTAALVCWYDGMNGRPSQLIHSRRLDARAAAKLAAAIRAVPLAHTQAGPHSCPMADGAADVEAFAYPGRADVDVMRWTTGCAGMGNGHISVERINRGLSTSWQLHGGSPVGH